MNKGSEDQDRSQKKGGGGWRRWLLLIIFALLTLWVYSRFTGFQDLANTLAKGRLLWLLIALVVHIAYFIMYAELYVIVFDLVGVATRFLEIIPVMFGALFLNAVAPSGGVAGSALFIDDAARRDESGARAAVGTVLVLLTDLSTLLPFLVAGLIYLALQQKLAAYDWITSLLYILFVAVLSGALALARWSPGTLQAVMEWLRRLINRVGGWFKHPDLVDEEWAGKNADEFALAAIAIRDHPRLLAAAVGWAVLMHGVNLVGLYTIFRAFDIAVQVGTLVAGFSLGIVFFVVTVIPQGVGTVEGVMALVFTSLGIPADRTVAIVLIYRAYNFWLPLFLGFFLLQRTGLFTGKQQSSEQSEEA